ncbi:STAS domain-containing protein [Marinomonas sp. C2222]|uniref:STAS domain-containing protein n=1 Tax=Marinomonas sargassi TaxID=2984494 RepID=A0ABT2YSQ4_9GAMM|nr:STAS domain-containing protein [Marinomonas sargassi]MCV2402785.1 STAS domain-containing protein [Marinomonas sargassi]
MSISIATDDKKDYVTITIIGNFDFSLFNDFRNAYTDLEKSYSLYIVDISNVEYLDSAALGMLLSMKNTVSGNATIQLKGANDFIKNILMISRFDKRFDIK